MHTQLNTVSSLMHTRVLGQPVVMSAALIKHRPFLEVTQSFEKTLELAVCDGARRLVVREPQKPDDISSHAGRLLIHAMLSKLT